MEDGKELKIFISHSSADKPLVEKLLSLLRVALKLTSKDIRCTSIDGYRLPIGEDTDERIRMEAIQSPVFLGLLSKNSFHSAYVLFELGARWGIGKKIMPLLSPEFDPSSIKGPILGKNALRVSEPGQLQQLIHDVSVELGISPEAPAVYQKLLEEVVSFRLSQELSTAIMDVVETKALHPREEKILEILAKSEARTSNPMDEHIIALSLGKSITIVKHHIDQLESQEMIEVSYRYGDSTASCLLSTEGRAYLVNNNIIK